MSIHLFDLTGKRALITGSSQGIGLALARGLADAGAEIVLNEGEREKLPPGSTLIPGMPVEAYVKTHDRTPMAYFMRPFTDYFAKAFRET